ncbi:MAG: hypothetical protein AAGN66_22790 [Acidobacteriota bacterium]
MTHGSTPREAAPPKARPRLQKEHIQAILDRGLEHCRQGDWKEGLVDLAWLAETQSKKDLPGLCYSYLGFGLARYRGQIDNGIRLCRHAIAMEFYQPENYLNMAKTCLLSSKYRRDAFEAVREGLEVDPENPELLRLYRELGMRRRPVLPFLSRGNILNRFCGWFRHQMSSQPAPPEDEEQPEADRGTIVTTVA